MAQGVAASQVIPYVEGLSRRGMTVMLHSMERGSASSAIAMRLESAGVRWVPHPWGGGGPTAGLVRVIRGARFLRNAQLVHARSDIPAGSALLARPPAWVWDMRGFWADERIAAGLLSPGSPQERMMRMIERRSARRAGAIVTLAEAAIEVLEQRHGAEVRGKTHVITTCVDLDRFKVSAMPAGPALRVLIAGTLGRRYDVPLMLRLVEHIRRRRPTDLTALVPRESPWSGILQRAATSSNPVSAHDMPAQVAGSHVGLCVLNAGDGVSLTASMPTKVGEFLASGRPVVVNAGLGDMDHLLAGRHCGVVLAGDRDSALEEAADDVLRLADDPCTPARCRAMAEAHFGLEAGVTALLEVYRRAMAAKACFRRPADRNPAAMLGGS